MADTKSTKSAATQSGNTTGSKSNATTGAKSNAATGAKSYDDRALSEPTKGALPKPQIEIIVDGKSVFKPGMKTYFVDDYETEEEKIETVVVGTYCSCDTVISSHLVCTCERVNVCTCQSHKITCPCQSNRIGGGTHTICTCQSVSCGSPCACIPVYY